MDMHKEVMNKAVIRNEEFKEILEPISEIPSMIDWEPTLENFSYAREEDVGAFPGREGLDLDWITSDEYLQKIMDAGRGHNGYPDGLLGVAPHPGDGGDRTIVWKEGINRPAEMVKERVLELTQFTGVRNRALTTIYPPGGGIGWHNNANASAYNVIITWSEKGDGFWEHVDPVSRKRVVIPDVAGWQCKYGFFGSYEDGPLSLCYHRARTNCMRMTLGFTFDRSENGKKMAEMLIEEIQTP